MLQHALIILLSGYLVVQVVWRMPSTIRGMARAARTGRAKESQEPPERPYGREGDPRKVDRTIRIDMSDAMRYFPDQVRVKRGATIRFSVRNTGELPHEMVIGTMDELKQHAEFVKSHGDTAHEAANVAHVAPAATDAWYGSSRAPVSSTTAASYPDISTRG